MCLFMHTLLSFNCSDIIFFDGLTKPALYDILIKNSQKE